MKYISIVTPNYNHGRYLADLIESCLQQSYRYWELIIVDDASTDNSLDVAERYAHKHDNIRIFKNSQNRGAIYSVNRGLKESRGEYVVMRSADDINLPGYFETAISMLNAHSQAALFCADVAYFREDPNVFQVETLGISQSPGYFAPNHLVNVLGMTPIHGHTVMIRKALLQALGYFQESHRWYNDWLPYMSWAFRKGVCYAPEPFVGCRLLSESFGNRGSTQHEAQAQVLSSILLDMHAHHQDIIPHIVASQALRFFGRAIEPVIASNQLFKKTFNAKPLPKAKDTAVPIRLNAGIYGVIHKTLYKQRSWVEKQFACYGDYKIWIYGAGMHTSILLRAWHDFNMPDIQGVLLSDESDTTTMKGLNVCCAKSVHADDVDLILISSKSYEQEILVSCKAMFAHASIITFWDRTSTQLNAPSSNKKTFTA